MSENIGKDQWNHLFYYVTKNNRIFIPPGTVAAVKELDLLTYMRLYEPGNLVRENDEWYYHRKYDSLKMRESNRLWYRHSRKEGHKSALDYLIHVKEKGFQDAVIHLCELMKSEPAFRDLAQYKPEKGFAPKPFALPERNSSNGIALEYLSKTRCIHHAVLADCIKRDILYESGRFHNLVFVGKDTSGAAKYASLRASSDSKTFCDKRKKEHTIFRMDVSGSNKAYSFAIPASWPSPELVVVEGAIDAMSVASLMIRKGNNHAKTHILSLGGVGGGNKQKEIENPDNALPIALETYLKHHSEIELITLCLDNDEAGRKATAQIKEALLQLGYGINVFGRLREGEDINEYLKRMSRQKDRAAHEL